MKLNNSKITQDELKVRLTYDSLSGKFYWKTVKRYSNRVVGDEAGTKSDGGYVVIKIDGTPYKAHRLAWLYMYGEFPKEYLDHANGVVDDNRILNLREATPQENSRNRKIHKNNSTGYKGVSFHKLVGKYKATAMLLNKNVNLGWYDTAEDASKIYQQFTKEHFGEFYKNI